MAGAPRYAVIGSRTTARRQGRGTGVEVWRLPERRGDPWRLAATARASNPTFLTRATPAGGFPLELYAVHGDGHEVSRLTLTQEGELTIAEARDTGGTNPVHLVTDATGRWLLVVNHSGRLVTLPIGGDGALGRVVGRVDLDGAPGPHRTDQPGPRPHHAVPVPALARAGGAQHFLVPDKGLDLVCTVRLDPGSGGLEVIGATALRQGSGPRHVVIDEAGATAYTIDELAGTVSVLGIGADGGLTLRAVHSALDPRDVRDFRGAEIVLGPDGRHLYASLRSGAGDGTPGGPGPDPVACFAVAADGGLTPLVWAGTGGIRPRFVTVHDHTLLVANERSHTITGLDLDPVAGTPGPARVLARTGSPVCLLLV